MVLAEGLEPPRLAPLVPKTSVSTIPPCERRALIIINQALVKGTSIAAIWLMKNIKELGKKLVDEAKNLVLETKGGEMPDPDQKPAETASEAAEVFENKKQDIKNLKDNVRDQLVVDDEGDTRDNDTEIDPEIQKKTG
jgi:hypothetical protein